MHITSNVHSGYIHGPRRTAQLELQKGTCHRHVNEAHLRPTRTELSPKPYLIFILGNKKSPCTFFRVKCKAPRGELQANILPVPSIQDAYYSTPLLLIYATFSAPARRNFALRLTYMYVPL